MEEELKQDKSLKTKKIKDIFNEINNRLQDEYPYAMCLSLLNDDVAQWERYADNAKGIEKDRNKQMTKLTILT